MIKSGYASQNEAVDNKAYEDFKKKCQANPTYKKAAAIAKKYGYQVAPLCYVDGDDNFIRFNVTAIDRNSYHPEIYFGSKFGKKPEFEIQTTAHGAMGLTEHAKFIDAVTDAHKMVAELSKLDLTTLEKAPMDKD